MDEQLNVMCAMRAKQVGLRASFYDLWVFMCAMRAKQVGLRASFMIYGCSCVPCVQSR